MFQLRNTRYIVTEFGMGTCNDNCAKKLILHPVRLLYPYFISVFLNRWDAPWDRDRQLKVFDVSKTRTYINDKYATRMLIILRIYSFQPHCGPGVDSASNRNEYQKTSWGEGGRRVRLTTSPHLWADCLEKMWEPRRLAILWASTACYRDSLARKADNLTPICEPIV
jgi:hypothetical protein